MANIIFKENQSVQQKLFKMQESAAFDITDGDNFACGNYSRLATDAPLKVPKLMISNDCVFDCAYCFCRASKDMPRYTNTPEEMADIAVKTAANDVSGGVFISSAVCKNADHTEELMLKTLSLIRKKHCFGGYVHAKIMPGTDRKLIREVGLLADRISVNIELPHSDGYKTIARQKNKTNILTPMTYVRDCINEFGRSFAPSGQSTQMIVGAMGESDRTLAVLAESLYKKYKLRRVYYSPFGPQVETSDVLPNKKTPFWRGRRMYQADRLMELYGMKADEILPENAPDLDFDIDPKAAYALRNIAMFPIEVNTADYEMLLRVPGIGIVGAQRIVKARRTVALSHEALKKIGVSLKKSIWFITCGGKYHGGSMLDSPFLRKKLWADELVFMQGMEQISLPSLQDHRSHQNPDLIYNSSNL